MKLTTNEANKLEQAYRAALRVLEQLEEVRPGGGFFTSGVDKDVTEAATENAKANAVGYAGCACPACAHRACVSVWEHTMGAGSKDALLYLLHRACTSKYPEAKLEATPSGLKDKTWVAYVESLKTKELTALHDINTHQSALLRHTERVLGELMDYCWPAPARHWRGEVNMKGLLEKVTPIIKLLRAIQSAEQGCAALAPVSCEDIAQVIYGNSPEYREGPPLSPDDYAAAERILMYFDVERKVR